jgi:hypothetical protein
MRVSFLGSSLILLAISVSLYGQSSADPFRVLRQTPIEGPRVTAYLRFHTELAWEQDELRQRIFKSIERENDLLQVQQSLRSKLMRMLGGLPETKTPLNPRITGQIQGKGFHVEKVIFESLPGFHVTALLYLPEDSDTSYPAILVACGHSPKGKAYYQTLCLRLVKRGYVVLCWDPIEPFDEKLLQCTRSGQVRLDFPEGRSLIDLIRQYYKDSKSGSPQTLKQTYYGDGYPGIGNWPVVSYDDKLPSKAIAAESVARMQLDGCSIDKYLLHHSKGLSIPLLHIRRLVGDSPQVLLWFTLRGKATQGDWPRILQLVEQGYQVLTWDFRGLGEDRMFYKASSPDDPGLVSGDWQGAYASSLSSVLANYVYNSLLTGRPYFMQMIEDTEIVVRFATESLKRSGFSVVGADEAGLLASSIAEVIPGVELARRQVDPGMTWSTLVTSGQEVWPIHYLLPGGAYIH